MLTYEKLFSNNWVIVYGVPLKSIMTGTEVMKNDFFACSPDVDRCMRTCDVFIQVDVKRYFRISRADREI